MGGEDAVKRRLLLLENYIAELEQIRQVTLDLYRTGTMRRRATEHTIR